MTRLCFIEEEDAIAFNARARANFLQDRSDYRRLLACDDQELDGLRERQDDEGYETKRKNSPDDEYRDKRGGFGRRQLERLESELGELRPPSLC